VNDRAKEEPLIRFVRAMNEVGQQYDHHTIARALGTNFIKGHELCADMEWRGLLRRHGPRCSSIVITNRGLGLISDISFYTRSGDADGRRLRAVPHRKPQQRPAVGRSDAHANLTGRKRKWPKAP
jgi:hypothetical protein